MYKLSPKHLPELFLSKVQESLFYPEQKRNPLSGLKLNQE
jgi:hypothetical protein